MIIADRLLNLSAIIDKIIQWFVSNEIINTTIYSKPYNDGMKSKILISIYNIRGKILYMQVGV